MGGVKVLFLLGLICLSILRPSSAVVSDNVERLIDTQAELLREIFNELTNEIENLQTNFENELRELETRLLADTEAKVSELQSQIDDIKSRECTTCGQPEQPAEPKPATKAPTEPPPPPPPKTTKAPTTTTKAPTTTKATTPAGPLSYRHCKDVREAGFDINGNYMIDPDGTDGPLEEFEVYCNMTDGGAFTSIGVQQASTMPITIKGLDDPGANVFTPNYLATTEQIMAVVTASSECRQWISYSCTSAVLLAYHKKKKLHHGWLISRDGDEMINWGGAPTNSLSCACGVTDTCFTKDVKCNCDANESKQKLNDSGYLDDIATLPIKSIHLGDVAGKKESGSLTLGSLECKA